MYNSITKSCNGYSLSPQARDRIIRQIKEDFDNPYCYEDEEVIGDCGEIGLDVIGYRTIPVYFSNRDYFLGRGFWLTLTIIKHNNFIDESTVEVDLYNIITNKQYNLSNEDIKQIILNV